MTLDLSKDGVATYTSQMLGLAHFSMLYQLLEAHELTFNRASNRHAYADQLRVAGLVDVEVLEQNNCCVTITGAGRHLATQASHVLMVWSSELAGNKESSIKDLRDALEKAMGAIYQAGHAAKELEAALALARKGPGDG